MKKIDKKSLLFLLLAVCLGGFALTSCDDDLDTNPYSKGGLNIVAFGPSPIARLDEMRITGTGLDRVDKVIFPKGIEVTDFTKVNSQEIKVIVPDEAVPGHIRIVAARDTAESITNLTFLEPIEVTDVTPTKGLVPGDIITVKGEYVYNISSVTFTEGVVVEAEDFVKNTRKELQIRVPMNAVSGEFMLTGESGDAVTEFVWDEPLEIASTEYTSLSKTSAEFGEQITIRGRYLNLVESVTYQGMIDDATFTVNADGTELTTTVPAETKTGTISLTQYSGVIVTTDELAVPTIEYTSIDPAEDLAVGDVVTITGRLLDRVKEIVLPGDITLVAGQFSQSDTQITFTVPEDMGDGVVTLIQNANISVETDRIAMHHDGAENVIWSGSWTCSDWAGNQDLAWDGFDWSTVKVGQEIIFYVDFIDPTAGWACISPRIGDGWGDVLGGQINLTPSAETQRVVFKPTAEQLASIQSGNGLVITGDGFILKQVALSILEEVIWSGTWECSGWAGNQDLAWGGYDWSAFSVGQKIIFTVEFIDPAGSWACISPRIGDGWGDVLGGQIELTPSAEAQRVEYKPTAEQLASIQSGGGLVITGDGFILKQVSIQ